MRITVLGIDPSDTRHAWALVSQDKSGVFTLHAHGRDYLSDEQNLDRKPNVIVIEMVACYGMTAGAHLFDTCVEIGRLLRTFSNCGIPTLRATRHSIKLALCRSAKATDSNVRTAIIDLFGGPESIKKGGQLYKVGGDTWAAIAVALYGHRLDFEPYIPAAQRNKEEHGNP